MSFTPEELRDFVATELNHNADIPPGHKGAIFAYLDDSGLRVGMAVREGDGWQIRGSVGFHPHEDGIDFGLSVMKTW